MKKIFLLIGMVIVMTAFSNNEVEARELEEIYCEAPEEVTYETIYVSDEKNRFLFWVDIENQIKAFNKEGKEVVGTVDLDLDSIRDENFEFKFGKSTISYKFRPAYSGKYKVSSGEIVVNLNIKPTKICALKNFIAVRGMPNCEYSLDKENWQDSVAFKKLTPNTTYTIYMREKDNEDSIITSTEIKTSKK